MSNIIYRACNVNGKMQIKLYFIYESNTWGLNIVFFVKMFSVYCNPTLFTCD